MRSLSAAELKELHTLMAEHHAKLYYEALRESRRPKPKTDAEKELLEKLGHAYLTGSNATVEELTGHKIGHNIWGMVDMPDLDDLGKKALTLHRERAA